MNTQIVRFKVMPDGNLEIRLLKGQRRELKEIINADMEWDSKFGEVCEYELCNGWNTVNPEDIGALTDAPIVSDEMSYNELGELDDIGKVYWFPDYMVVDPLEELLKYGKVIFEGQND